MKIKVSKNYQFNCIIADLDKRNFNRGIDTTWSSPMTSTWEEMDVDIDQLHELIYKGYAIMINC